MIIIGVHYCAQMVLAHWRTHRLVTHHLYVSHGHPRDGYLSLDRKSTRLNSSHPSISYAVFCLKKKKKKKGSSTRQFPMRPQTNVALRVGIQLPRRGRRCHTRYRRLSCTAYATYRLAAHYILSL